jgi:hypothetical protein
MVQNEDRGRSLVGNTVYLAGNVRHQGIGVAIGEPMHMVPRIDDQHCGAQGQHSGNDCVPVWKDRTIACSASLSSNAK